MKIHCLKKVQWWVLILSVVMVFSGCAHKAQKSETKPSESREPASAKPGTGPPEQAPPSMDTQRAPGSQPTTTAPSAEPMPKKSYFTHTVKWSGETLFIIAAWYTGDRENWKALADAMVEANPNANIHLILLGNKILIPESLLKTRNPMPKEFVDSFFQKPKTGKAPPRAAPSQAGEEEPKLFGPKE